MRHKTRLFPVVGALACICLAMVFAFVPEPAQARAPVLTPRVLLPLSLRGYRSEPPTASLFGVSDSTPLALVTTPQGQNLAITAGVYWNRTSVAWIGVEPVPSAPAQFHWDGPDSVIPPLLAQGIQPLVLIGDNPSWAAATPCGPVHNVADLAEFVGALGARYPAVRYWGFYNESDLTTYSVSHVSNGGCFGETDLDHNNTPDYADYAEMMRAAWKALHSANPEAKLVFGLLAYDNFDPNDSPPNYPGGCCFGYHFLDNLLGYMRAHPLPAGEQYADVLGFNDYRLYNDYYWELFYPGDGIAAKINALRQKMQEYGFNFPMLASEVSSGGTEPAAGGISYHEQARDLARMMTQSAASGLDMSVWWTFADYPNPCGNSTAVASDLPAGQIKLAGALRAARKQGGASPDELCSWPTHGIVDEYQRPKPSYYAFKIVSEQLRGWTPLAFKTKAGLSVFTFEQGPREKRVYYVKSGGPRTVTLTSPELRVVDLFGAPKVLRADDKGKVTLTVGEDPIYVELNR